MRWRWALGLFLAPALTIGITAAANAAELRVSADSPRQGESVEVTVSGIESSGTVPSIKFNSNEYKLFPVSTSGEYRALIGIPADLDAGAYKL
jgi:hypothetical protein